jgi:hypothetical protein
MFHVTPPPPPKGSAGIAVGNATGIGGGIAAGLVAGLTVGNMVYLACDCPPSLVSLDPDICLFRVLNLPTILALIPKSVDFLRSPLLWPS